MKRTGRKLTGNNGHDASPFGGVIDPISVNRMRELVTNFTTERQAILRRMMGGDTRRSINDECGYPDFLTIADYKTLYDREPIAKRTCQVLSRECWQGQPRVYDSEDTHKDTAFSLAIKEVDQRLRGEQSWYEDKENKSSPLMAACKLADELCGVGSFGIILVGLDDGRAEDGSYRGLAQPVAGLVEKGSMPKEGANGKPANNEKPVAQPWSLTVNAEDTKGRKLLYLRVFDESVVQVTQFEMNQASPRYGKPVMYLIRINEHQYSTQSGAAGLPLGTLQVHWTRVVHIADNLENSEVFGVSRLHTPYNSLYNIQKIRSADGETYWRNCVLKLFFETHPQLGGDVEVDEDSLRDMMENMMNGLQQWGQLSGMSAKPVAPAVTDPTPHILVNIESICIMIPCPKRVFMGSERGELASSQDDAAWNDTLRGRQHGFITPRIVVPLFDRLIQCGVLPQPRSYGVSWPDLESLSDDAAATVANKWADALGKYLAGGLENIIDPMDYFTRILRLGEDEAESILNNTLRWLEFQKWTKMSLGTLELEPAGEWPEEVPLGADEAGVSVGHPQAGDAPPAADGSGGNPFGEGDGQQPSGEGPDMSTDVADIPDDQLESELAKLQETQNAASATQSGGFSGKSSKGRSSKGKSGGSSGSKKGGGGRSKKHNAEGSGNPFVPGGGEQPADGTSEDNQPQPVPVE